MLGVFHAVGRVELADAMTRFGQLGPGSWCWFGDPRAVVVNGQTTETVVGWLDDTGRVTVAAVGRWSDRPITHVVGYEFHDDHGAPSILVEPDRRLTVFWSGHNGAHMYFRTTLRPGDITAWGPRQEMPRNTVGHLGFTYPNPVILPSEGNRLYLFWRGGDWSADYATRSAGGAWMAPHELIRVPGQRPYLKVASDGAGTIDLAFTNGHPRNLLTSIYFAEYRHGSLWSASGRWIGRLSSAPIAPDRADVVYDGRRTGVASWVWDVADDRGHPVIVYATFPSPGNHAYWYARWDGRRWVSHFLTHAGPSISPGSIEREYSGGIALDHSDPSVVYLSRHVAGGWQIERWATRNGGATWRTQVVVPSGHTDNVRPVVPRGSAAGTLRLLWLQGRYGTYTDYHTHVEFLR
jgi:hypothetical protein